MSLVRTLAVLLPALISLAAAPVVGKAFVLVAASPVLVLIGHQLLTPYLHHAFAAGRSSRERGSPADAHQAEAVGRAEPPREEEKSAETSCAEGRSSAV